MSRFKNLVVWQEAIALAEMVYNLTDQLSEDSKNTIGKEMRYACVSVSGNIAEGAGRNNLREYIRYLSNASGSCNRLVSICTLASNLNVIDEVDLEEIDAQAFKISNMLHNFKVSLRKKMNEDNQGEDDRFE